MNAIRRNSVRGQGSRILGDMPGIYKAIDIAMRLRGASIELFHAISAPVFLDLQPLTGTSVAELKSDTLQQQLRSPQNAHVTRANALGVKATCKVRWDYPPHEAIVRRARSGGARISSSRNATKAGRLKPWLTHLTDWELLRLSPVAGIAVQEHPPLSACLPCSRRSRSSPPPCEAGAGSTPKS